MTTTVPAHHTLPTPTRTGVWRRGLTCGICAAVVTEIYGALARTAGVTMRAGNIGADHADPITVGMFAMGTLLCTLIGTVVAAALIRRSNSPRRTFRGVALVLTALSLLGPALAGDTTVGTKTMLIVAHLIAATIVVPALSLSLPPKKPTPSPKDAHDNNV